MFFEDSMFSWWKPPSLDQLSSAILGLVELLGEQLNGVVQLDHLAHQLPVGVIVARLKNEFKFKSKRLSCMSCCIRQTCYIAISYYVLFTQNNWLHVYLFFGLFDRYVCYDKTEKASQLTLISREQLTSIFGRCDRLASLVSATFKGGFFASRALLRKATWWHVMSGYGISWATCSKSDFNLTRYDISKSHFRMAICSSRSEISWTDTQIKDICSLYGR